MSLIERKLSLRERSFKRGRVFTDSDEIEERKRKCVVLSLYFLQWYHGINEGVEQIRKERSVCERDDILQV